MNKRDIRAHINPVDVFDRGHARSQKCGQAQSNGEEREFLFSERQETRRFRKGKTRILKKEQESLEIGPVVAR